MSHIHKRVQFFESNSKKGSILSVIFLKKGFNSWRSYFWKKEGSSLWVMFKRRFNSLSHVKKGSLLWVMKKSSIIWVRFLIFSKKINYFGSILWVIWEGCKEKGSVLWVSHIFKKGSILRVTSKEKVQLCESFKKKRKRSFLWVLWKKSSILRVNSLSHIRKVSIL